MCKSLLPAPDFTSHHLPLLSQLLGKGPPLAVDHAMAVPRLVDPFDDSDLGQDAKVSRPPASPQAPQLQAESSLPMA